MAKVVYEYQDAKGETHRVSDIRQVPEAYLRSVVSYGVKELEQKTRGREVISVTNIPGFLPQRLEWKPIYAVPILLVLVWYKFNTYFMRFFVIAVAAFWLFLQAYNWFLQSNYSKTSLEIEKRGVRF